MKEIKNIIESYAAASQLGKRCALATVVQLSGSAYRRPGARMLITEDGQLTGAISGGCLEGDALKKSLHAMAQQRAMIVTYDTTDDDDAKLGVGLGCNGIIHILIEPISEAHPRNPLALLRMALLQRSQTVITTLFNLQDRNAHQPGTCFLYKDGNPVANTICQDIERQMMADAATAISSHLSHNSCYTCNGSAVSGLVEYISPVVSLLIAGAGNDVMPLAAMAAVVGWQVSIADGRYNMVSKMRFPTAQQLITAKPGQVLDHITVDEHTVCLLMTHNYNYDLAMLQQLVTTATPYIGILGPKKKRLRMIDELTEQGISLTACQLQKISGPAGLDIGAETPEEIALSIMAEIKAVLSSRPAKPLKDKKGAIHAQLHA